MLSMRSEPSEAEMEMSPALQKGVRRIRPGALASLGLSVVLLAGVAVRKT
jgi:hypothetical protein